MQIVQEVHPWKRSLTAHFNNRFKESNYTINIFVTSFQLYVAASSQNNKLNNKALATIHSTKRLVQILFLQQI